MSTYKYKVSICAMYKNEAQYLSEWIEYHRMIGIEHFYLYNNNSNDHHLSVLEPYLQNNLVTYHNYPMEFTNATPYDHCKDSNYPYNHCIRQYSLESQYLAFID